MNHIDDIVLVALDWGNDTHAFALQMQAAGARETGTIAASAEGLHAWLEQLHQRAGARPVALAVEAGAPGVMAALLEHPWLTLYALNPAMSARFRSAFHLAGAKDDVPDAEVLLTLLRAHRDRLRPWQPDQAATRELSALVAARRASVDTRTQLCNQLRDVLKAYFPQALALGGPDLYCPLTLDLLTRWPELAAIQTARPQTLRDFYARHNVRSAERIAARVQHVAQARALTTDRAVIAPARLQVRMLVTLLRAQAGHIAAFEQRIQEVFAAHPQAEFFAALPGAGPALAPRLLVAFGDDRTRYPDAASLQQYAGVAPVREKSGQQLWTHWRWRAPKFLRQSFVEWAGQTVVQCAWAKAYYQQQQRAGKAHHAILRALAFKWIRILWRCWHDAVPYDETRYLAALQQRRSPLHDQVLAPQPTS